MTLIILVIECQPRINWYTIFSDTKCSDQSIQVEQATWSEIKSICIENNQAYVNITPSVRPHIGTSQERSRTIIPDFILMRSVCRSIKPLDDRHKLYALQYANLPSVNSLQSCYLVQERVWMMAALQKLEHRLGHECFPLIKQIFYANHKDMAFHIPEFPCVVKIGPYHSGFGKILVHDRAVWDDVHIILHIYFKKKV